MKRAFLVFLYCCIPTAVFSQYITIDENYTNEQLVQTVLIQNSPCANVSNIAVTGHNFGSGNSFGYFSAGTSSFPFADGIILTTGMAASAVGPNTSLLSEGPSSWPGDSDLEQALSVNNSINATVLEFDFLPQTNKISFDYIFSSEQYLTSPSSNQCNYTDGFAFLLKEAAGSGPYQNLAVIPNTTIPVKVNTVRGPGTICPPANEEYFGGFNGSEHPTNYNGQTVVMTAQANVTPNVLYHIKLVVADQGNNLYDSAIFLGGGSFNVGADLGPDKLLSANTALCPGETYTLDATEPGTNTYKWFKNGFEIFGETNPTYVVHNMGTYSVEVSLNATLCKPTDEVIIEYATAPALNDPTTLVECDDNNDGTTLFDLTKMDAIITMGATGLSTVVYYETLSDAQNQVNAISNPDVYSGNHSHQLIARVTNAYGCAAYATVILQISNNTITNQPVLEVCDTNIDGITQFNLADADSQVVNGLPAGLVVSYYLSAADAVTENNPLPLAGFTNTVPFVQYVYARIVNGPDCYGIIPVKLVANVLNPPNFQNVIIPICQGDTKILSVPTGYASYSWNTTPPETGNQISVSAAGTYTVTVTDANGCEASKTFVVTASGPATVTGITIDDFSGGDNSVLINYTGIGSYEFSLDGNYFQTTPLFTNVPAGEYFVYVNDINGCGIVGPIHIYVLDYPKFFTPNGDGYNDLWTIPFLRTRPGSTVSIFDRYGKLIYSFTGTDSGWDGNLKSQMLPSTDYWFVLSLADGKIIKGHFSLKR